MRSKIAVMMSLSVFLISGVLAVAEGADFKPDPAAVVRYGPAYRYPQQGWLVVHIEGEPYERGVQHGRLMSSEIAGHMRCFAKMYGSDGPNDAWELLRMLGSSLFLPRFEREYLEEMRGIADGATAAGAKFDGRPLDLTDIVTLNLWPEIMTIPWAAEAMPNGLEGTKFPDAPAKTTLPPKPGHCSAFAATGPATADGKVVFGHITMFSLYPSTFYNVWLDVKPSNGHRVLMQTFPGGIASGMDYYMNDAGILVSETTLDQTRLDIQGSPQSSRIRKALQYSDSIDDVVRIISADNNGLYTNEWLLADTKTNEIAMFELGTHASKLYRSSKGEWFGGTPGFYWGCNNTKDLAVRLETIAATNDRPANMVWHPSDRDEAWIKLYRKHKGKMDVEFAKEAFTTPPICASASVDAKFTTTDLARDLKSWALFGPPRGKTWLPTDEEKRKYPEVDPLVSNPWTVLHGDAPESVEPTETAVDLDEKDGGTGGDEDGGHRRDAVPPTKLVWRGTLLPKSDGDIWLAAAFADYHRTMAREQGMVAVSDGGCLCAKDLSKLATSLFSARSRYLSAASKSGDTPLATIRSDDGSRDWYRIASGKGVLVLNELRWRLGDDKFVAAVDGFGLKHAGQPVAWTEFAAHVQEAAGEKLDAFFDYWVNKPGLPKLALGRAELQPREGPADDHQPYRIEAVLTAEGGPLPVRIEVTVEAGKDETTKSASVDPATGSFSVESDDRPKRLIVDKYSRIAKANGGRFDLLAFTENIEETLIIYGTADDEAGNRDAAELLQEKIRTAHANFDVPVVSDSAATEEQLRDHHLILVGGPGANRVTQRLRDALPLKFAEQSFEVCGQTYAHYRSAVIAAGANPLNPRYAVSAVAGLSALATYRAVTKLGYDDFGVEVKVLPHGDRPKKLVVPPAELIHDFREAERVSKAGTE